MSLRGDDGYWASNHEVLLAFVNVIRQGIQETPNLEGSMRFGRKAQIS
jgi:hypothetical protein